MQPVQLWDQHVGYEEATFDEGGQRHVIVGRHLIVVKDQHYDGSIVKRQPPKQYVKFFRYVSTFLVEPLVFRYPNYTNYGEDFHTAFCVKRDYGEWLFVTDRHFGMGLFSDNVTKQFGQVAGCYKPASIEHVRSQIMDALESIWIFDADDTEKEVVIGVHNNSKIIAASLYYKKEKPALQIVELPYKALKMPIPTQLALPWGSDWSPPIPKPIKRRPHNSHQVMEELNDVLGHFGGRLPNVWGR